MKIERKKLGLWVLMLLLLGVHILCRSQAAHAAAPVIWQEMVPRSGNCKISFPGIPQLVQQSFQVDEMGTRLNYDVYLAPYHTQGVCILLIAQYPARIPAGKELMGLQGLVKGILNQNSENKLMFSDLLVNQTFPAVNFLINSTNNYFRAQAVLVGDVLYMIAMEGGKKNFDESIFNKFLGSFRIDL
jgi:hypothetical protein